MATNFTTSLTASNAHFDMTTTILTNAIPGAVTVTRSAPDDDKIGIDCWVATASGKRLGVDVKLRKTDPVAFGQDDLALETWSVIERNVVGWTRDESKHTDFVLWIFQSSGRFYLAPFVPLCSAMQTHWRRWCTEYKTCRQSTAHGSSTWTSEVVFVPRTVVTEALVGTFSQ